MPGIEGIMEDPVLGILRELMISVSREYRITHVDIRREEDEIRVVFKLRPVIEGATISLWRLLDLEEKIMRKLSFEALFTHSRIGLDENGDMIVTYIFRKITYK